MFLLKPPSEERIRHFLADQQGSKLSYPEVGASFDQRPEGYAHDRYRILLGHGLQVFEDARHALRRWAMFQLGWVRLYQPDTPIQEGATVAILIRHFGFWSLNASRIVYVFEEEGPIERYGFGYGTLLEHAERGEERFAVGWNRSDGSVWYEVSAFSRPRSRLARLGAPLTRHLQKKFARDSKRAMLEAVRQEGRDSPEDKAASPYSTP